MSALRILFRSIGQALCAEGLRALAGLVPFGEALYDIASAAADNFQKLRDEARQRAVLQEVVQAALEDIKIEAEATAREVCVGQPEAVRSQVAAYLMQVPSLLRQSCKRPGDASGRSIPLALSFQKPADWLAILPAHPPRFRAGERPSGVGDWELVDLLGVGGFGEVWKARHCYFDGIAPVALKFCLNAAAKSRLLKYEASVLNQVLRHGPHPGVVALLDAHLNADPPCLKYEFVEGGDLTGLMREWQPLPFAERWAPATRLLAQLAAIVGAAHRLAPPIVHRDLKPANVLVQRGAGGDFVLRVTDFGIGGVAALPALLEARQGTTTRGVVLGTSLRGAHTPLYASPQQMRGEPPDVRDDVHSLGVIWYQLLTGDLGSAAPTGLWADELADAGLSRDLIHLLGACVAARPERRPADASALTEQLNAFLSPLTSSFVSQPAALDTKPSSWLLDLTNKQLGDTGLVALAQTPSLAQRSVLYLSGNQIGDAGAAALAASPFAVNLTRLILWDNWIGDDGVTALARSPHLSHLTALDLGHNRVGDDGVKALAASPHLTGLAALILVSNQIGDAGAAALAASPYLANLAELKPLNNRITSAGVTALRERFGKRVRIY